MITNRMIRELKKICPDTSTIEKGLVYSFANSQSIKISGILEKYIQEADIEILNEIDEYISSLVQLSWSDLVEAFELLVPESEKKGKELFIHQK